MAINPKIISLVIASLWVGLAGFFTKNHYQITGKSYFAQCPSELINAKLFAIALQINILSKGSL